MATDGVRVLLLFPCASPHSDGARGLLRLRGGRRRYKWYGAEYPSSIGNKRDAMAHCHMYAGGCRVYEMANDGVKVSLGELLNIKDIYCLLLL